MEKIEIETTQTKKIQGTKALAKKINGKAVFKKYPKNEFVDIVEIEEYAIIDKNGKKRIVDFEFLNPHINNQMWVVVNVPNSY